MNIIAVTGRKYNGKDSIADYLVKNHGYIKLSFADQLKKALELLFNFDHEQLYGSKKEVVDEYWGYSPRYLMQYLGTQVFRDNIDQDFWVKSLENNILKNYQNKKIVISDLRFMNEYNMIKRLGGYVIKVKRDNINNTDQHESESMTDNLDYDFFIQNNYDLDYLHKLVELALKDIENII
jgi:hypothetical protein